MNETPLPLRTLTWASQAFFYHIYPLGVCGAPWSNPGGAPVPRIHKLVDWIEPARQIGANAVLLGPLWESASHGYDTHDYHKLDRRLGTNDDLKAVVAAWKAAGFRVVFDGVFNHCGREFPQFADLRAQGSSSIYRDWFAGVDFGRPSPQGDPFWYEGWNGHFNLVKFNLADPEVRAHLFDAVLGWIDAYDLDGLRLDAADVIDKDFLRDLSQVCRERKPDFWLMGEVIHGDYNAWAPGAGLDAVTNYELYKGLWSSHNDGNYFELAWTLNRQFGPEGLYRGRLYYTFGDNHDVDRLASTLTDDAYLYPHTLLTMTVPGVPSVYYGTEAGLTGKKAPGTDAPLRPELEPMALDSLTHGSLRDLWTKLAAWRAALPCLQTGGYRQATLASRQFSFWRTPEGPGPAALVAVNSASDQAKVEVEAPEGSVWVDLLSGERVVASGGKLRMILWPQWGRILVPEGTQLA